LLLFPNNKKVIHSEEALFLDKRKLYTVLSTLSTLMNYSCRMRFLLSITKMRFVTYVKSTLIDRNFDYSA